MYTWKKGTLMTYLSKKYGNSVPYIQTSSIQNELLLNDAEYRDIKSEVAELLGVDRCPSNIDFEVFEYMVGLHL